MKTKIVILLSIITISSAAYIGLSKISQHENSTQPNPAVTSKTLFRTNPDRHATVTINILDSLKALQIRDLLIYHDNDSTLYKNYTPKNILTACLIIEITNNFGVEIIGFDDFKLSGELSNIQKHLFDYEIIASSKKIDNYYNFTKLVNGDQITIILKPNSFWYNFIWPITKNLAPLESIKVGESLEKEVLNLHEYSLLHKFIVKPGAEGPTDFTISEPWKILSQNGSLTVSP
jgi:hypothetical protein